MSSRLRVGIVGAGPVTERYHVPAINAVPEVVRSVVMDLDGERARSVAERYAFPRATRDLQEFCANADVAILAVPNGQHAAVACELLSRGIPVLCEKPMARNPSECARMIQASRRSGAPLCIGHNRRFRSHIHLAKRLLERGIIGEVIRVNAEEGSPNDWPRSASYFDPIASGGGALMDVGIHAIDLIRWLVGEFGECQYRGDGTETSVESEAELNFTLSTGASGTVTASRKRSLRQILKLSGSDGSLEIGLWGPSLAMRSTKGKAFQNFKQLDIAVSRRPPHDTSFLEQLRNFVGAVKGAEHLLVDGEEGKAAVDVVYRAYGGEKSSVENELIDARSVAT